MRRTLILAAVAFLGGCEPPPSTHSENVCRGALEGVRDPSDELVRICTSDVYAAGFNAEEDAAQKYRDLPRRAKR